MSKALSVYLIESGQVDAPKQTERVDVFTPKDENGDEIIVCIEAETVTISKLMDSIVVEKQKIVLAEV